LQTWLARDKFNTYIPSYGAQFFDTYLEQDFGSIKINVLIFFKMNLSE